MCNDFRFFTSLCFVQNDRGRGTSFRMTRGEGTSFGMIGDEGVSFRMTE